MTILKHQPVLPDLPVRTVQEMGLKELERIRLILRGGSVIEWRRLHFKLWDEVDRFLRLCQIDATRPHDVEWVRTVLGDAVEHGRRAPASPMHGRFSSPVARRAKRDPCRPASAQCTGAAEFRVSRCGECHHAKLISIAS